MTEEELESWQGERIKAILAHFKSLPPQRQLEYFREIVAQIVIGAADIGDFDWPAELHLGDFIEKHLVRFAVHSANN